MRTLRTASRPLPNAFSSARRIAGLFLLAAFVVLTGCDSSGDLDDGSDDLAVSAEETAESIAFATAEQTAGTASDLSAAASLLAGASSTTSAAKNLSRNRSCSYDDGTDVWTCESSLVGSGGRLDSINVERQFRLQFFSGSTPVRRPADADSMILEVVRGTGRVQTARIDNSHTLVATTWSLARTATAGEFRVALADPPAGRSVQEFFAGPRRERTRNAEVRRTSTDGLIWRTGSPGRFVAGTLDGTYQADVTITRANGEEVSRSVDASYAITFSESSSEITFTGGGERFNGTSFTFDASTGTLE